MVMFPCSDCTRNISTDADVCPWCGKVAPTWRAANRAEKQGRDEADVLDAAQRASDAAMYATLHASGLTKVAETLAARANDPQRLSTEWAVVISNGSGVRAGTFQKIVPYIEAPAFKDIQVYQPGSTTGRRPEEIPALRDAVAARWQRHDKSTELLQRADQLRRGDISGRQLTEADRASLRLGAEIYQEIQRLQASMKPMFMKRGELDRLRQLLEQLQRERKNLVTVLERTGQEARSLRR